MLQVTHRLAIPDHEIEMTAVRASGPGGQNVNKVASAIHLRFDIANSSLPEQVRGRLLGLRDRRISREGVVVIKAQRYRDQEKNRADALQRLADLIRKALKRKAKRVPTKPSKSARRKRTDEKVKRGRVKQLRAKVRSFD